MNMTKHNSGKTGDNH